MAARSRTDPRRPAAGGCGPPAQIDEDWSGARNAGSIAHRQLRQFLSRSGQVEPNELEIPRATKSGGKVADSGCQAAGVHEGFADLFKRGGVAQLAEVKPVYRAQSDGVLEVEHYVRRSRQSFDRLTRNGGCGYQTAEPDDQAFAGSMGQLGPFFSRQRFTRLRGTLPANTVIGPFQGDTARTLKAKLVAPGAVGYWCTGGQSETLSCPASPGEIDRYIDRVLATAQFTVDDIINRRFIKPIDDALKGKSTLELLKLAKRHVGPRLRQLIADKLGIPVSLVPDIDDAALKRAADLIDNSLGAIGRQLLVDILNEFKTRVLAELRRTIRAQLRQVLRNLIATICVGVPVITLAHLLDELKKWLDQHLADFVKSAIATVMVGVAEAVARLVANAIREALRELGGIILKVLAFIALVLLAVAAVVVAILLVISIVDLVPGDEVIIGAIEAFIINLLRALGGFVFA
jgi:hypothetical protein